MRIVALIPGTPHVFPEPPKASMPRHVTESDSPDEPPKDWGWSLASKETLNS